MCNLFLSIGEDTRFPFVAAFNRDEVIARPAKTAHLWTLSNNSSHVFGGIDSSGGGTWLAISTYGRFAAILNCNRPVNENTDYLSRGAVVSDFVTGSENIEQYSSNLVYKSSKFRPFNFVGMQYANGSCETVVVTKPTEADQGYMNHLGSGIHVVGNTPYGQTAFKKMEHGQQIFSNIISSSLKKDSLTFDMLQSDIVFNVLTNTTQCYPDEELDRLRKVSVPSYIYPLSQIFVPLPHYQTRCSTVVAIDKEQQIHFVEYTWMKGLNESGQPQTASVVRESFKLQCF